MDADGRADPLAPDRALVEGRLELAVLADEIAVATNEQERRVDGSSRSLVELCDSDDHIDPGLGRRGA